MKCSVSLVVAIGLYLVVMGLWAGSKSTSALHGQVTMDGQPLANAAIDLFLLRPEVPGAYARTIVSRTGQNGAYEVAELPRGDYVLLVWKHGIRLYQGKVHVVAQSDNVRDIAAVSNHPARSAVPENVSSP
jgi:hypothetical protein